jgi:hypothetical protein
LLSASPSFFDTRAKRIEALAYQPLQAALAL